MKALMGQYPDILIIITDPHVLVTFAEKEMVLSPARFPFLPIIFKIILFLRQRKDFLANRRYSELYHAAVNSIGRRFFCGDYSCAKN